MLNKIRSIIESYRKNGIIKTIGRIEQFIYIGYIKPAFRFIYVPISIYVHSILSNHLNVYNDDWDMLIILDTCRPDALNSVSSEYEFLDNISSRWSVGSHSAEWMMNTFTEKFKSQISETAYITSNPNSVTILEEDYDKTHAYSGQLPTQISRLFKYNTSNTVYSGDFYKYTRIWDRAEEYGGMKYPAPRAVTDQAIETDRNDNPNRIIVHYMPPHSPYLANLVEGEVRISDTPRLESFDAYLDNLRWALNEVDTLLKNVDRGRVIITADHGESFSFRRWRGGHPVGAIYPSVRRVPWCVTDATDSKTYRPDSANEPASSDTKEVLEALGYL